MMNTRLVKKLCAGLLLAGLLATPAQAETVTYLHTDLLGSVVLETDQNRNVVQRYEYEPYGLPRQAMVDQPGYTGHVHDAGSGLVYMQQRYYDPEVGRFLSVDPVGVDTRTGGNFNRYWYGNNNPYTYTDPDGRAACTVAPPAPLCVAAATLLARLVSNRAAQLVAVIVANEGAELDSVEPTTGSGESEGNRVLIGDKIKDQLGDRGWTEAGIRDATAGEATGTTVDNTRGKVGSAGEPALVYGSPEGGYVVVNDKTREVIQVAPSTETDPGWKPDPRIEWKK